MRYDIKLKLAGVPFAVLGVHEKVKNLCADYITEEAPEFTVVIDADRMEREREKFQALDIGENRMPVPRSDVSLESNALYRETVEHLSQYAVILLHGSAIAVDGETYIFVAPSGTGKSTHTRLWREAFGERAVMVNDDKPLLKCTDDGIYVCGSPWNGKHHLGSNVILPLKAICFLERGETNQIQKLSEKDAFLPLLEAVYYSGTPEREKHILQSLQRIRQETAFYRLKCSMEPEAAIVSYEGMNSRNESCL